MATYDVTSLFPRTVNSDTLFPAFTDSGSVIIATESDHFSIRYKEGAFEWLIVTFVSNDHNLVYSSGIPSGGTFNEIKLASGTGVLDGIAHWSGFPNAAITAFNGNL